MQLEDAKYAVIALITLGIVLTVAALIADSFKGSVSTDYKISHNISLAPASRVENFSADTETYSFAHDAVVSGEVLVFNVSSPGWNNGTVPSTNYSHSVSKYLTTINITSVQLRTSSPVASIWLVYNYTTPLKNVPYNATVQTLNTFETGAKFMPLIGIVIFGAVVLGLVAYFGFAE